MSRPTPPRAGTPGRDPGLQPQRTRLAWRRTTLVAAVAAVLAGRRALYSEASAITVAVTAVAALLLLAFLATAHLRIRALDAPRPPSLSPRTAVAAAGYAVALVACGVALL